MTSSKIILLCGAGYVSGKEIVALELAKGLISRGFPLHVVSSSWNDGDFVRRLSDAGIDYELMPTGFISAKLSLDCLRMTGEQMLRWPQLMWSYRKMLARELPSAVIHTNWHHILLLRSFLRPHRDYLWLHECVPNSNRYRYAYQHLAHRLRKVICVSHAVAESLLALGLSKEKVEIIHNGLTDCAGDQCRDHAINHINTNIGIAGQIGAWKGHEDLLIAFGLIAQQHSDVQLHVFGAGSTEYVARLQDLARTLNIDQRVIWHGFTSDRRRIYANLNICVVPSRSNDPLPTTALEAAFFGIPVIATCRGGLPEIVADNETGILVDAENPEQLSAALKRLLADPLLRRKMSTAARARATTYFCQTRFIDEFLCTLSLETSQSAHASPVPAVVAANQ
ncbi:MAG: glycosyltransferase family 4 protein [Pirellulales bacterium]